MKSVAQYNSDEMREIAREYESQWTTDESSADVDKYDFTFEKYDLPNLKVDLRKFLESEYKSWLSQFGEEDADERLMYFMEEYPLDELSQKNDPLVIIEKDGKGYVWDGTHRTSGLLENNIYDAWAIVGRPKEELSESGSKGGSKLNLKQALEIKENQYRSRDAQRDYQPEEVDERIIELLSKKDERDLKLFEQMMDEAPEDYFDRYLVASSTITYKDASTLKRGDEDILNDLDSLIEQSYMEMFDQNYEFIALDGRKPIGMIACESGGGEISIVVDPEYHQKGIGKTLVNMLVEKAKNKDYEFLLAVPITNISRKLFKDLGWEPRGGGFILTEDRLATAEGTDWPPKWLGYGVTEKDLAFLYAVADNFTGFLTEGMLEDYQGTVYRKSEHDEENHDSFWTSDKSVADKFEGKLRMLEFEGRAWIVSKYLADNHQRLAKIKHELGEDSKMGELEELVTTGLAYNSTEVGSIIIPGKNVKKENIIIVEE